MRLKSQKTLHVQGDAGHPGKQGGGQGKNNRKRRYMESLTSPPQKKKLNKTHIT
jgi:hypothetical protein